MPVHGQPGGDGVKKALAAIACVLGLLLGNPGLAAADIEVHAWNTSAQPPRLFFSTPVALTAFTTGDYTNATLVATCLLKQYEPGVWEHDDCTRSFWDFDRTGTSGCWYNRGQQRWIGYFVTQTWIAIHFLDGTHRTIALYSEPVELTCSGGRSA